MAPAHAGQRPGRRQHRRPALFFTRLLSTFCAPTFIALTGLSAWLYGQSHTKAQVSEFLFKRGLFLLLLEVTVVSYSARTQPLIFPPPILWLQVIWTMTKYPPSLLFLLPTVGTGALLLALLEKYEDYPLMPHIAIFGGAPMFFYLLHLYVLKPLYLIALAIYGPTKSEIFGLDHVSTVWIWVAILLASLYLPTRWFAGLKQRRKDIWWLKYL